jgi:hypothetical protein
MLAVIAFPLYGAQRGRSRRLTQLTAIEVNEPGGQILSYRYNTRSTEVRMRGTRLASQARVKLKVESRPGFLEIDINRGDISGLQQAHSFGKDFFTYVMWAVSVDGKASNLGEITFDNNRPISINVTTPYQTFWLMVTAEPDYAVADPSSNVVLYSLNQDDINEKAARKALPIGGRLFYFTHYTGYDSSPSTPENAPNALLQARKAVELASKSGNLTGGGPDDSDELTDEGLTRRTLQQAKNFLARAESTYRSNPGGSNVIQFARTAAQIAENARAMAQGAVGGAYIWQLKGQVSQLQTELSVTRAALARARREFPPLDPGVNEEETEVPPVVEPDRDPDEGKSIVTQPTVWFGLIGWGLALLLLLRRKAN